MRKSLILFVLLVLLFALTPFSAQALLPSENSANGVARPGKVIMTGPNIDPGFQRDYNSGILGQNHSYSVIFRGNGEAIVTARMIFSNLTGASQSNYRLRIPQVDPRDIIVYQQVRRGRCLKYRTPPSPEVSSSSLCPLYATQKECNLTNESEFAPQDVSLRCHWLPCANKCLPRGITKETACPQPVCSNWEEPDYYNIYYGNNEYKKLQFTQNGDETEFQLVNPINPRKTGALLINYRAFGYSNKNILGGYNYIFETAKIPDKIYSLQVGISVDTDLLLRQDTGKINYYPESGSGVSMMAPMMEKGAFSSTQLNDYYNQVGLGAVVKTASNLQPSESYSVKGTYADRTYKLYPKEIFLGLAVFLLILVVILAVVKHLTRIYLKLMQQGIFVQKTVMQQKAGLPARAGLPAQAGRPKKAIAVTGNLPQPYALPLIESFCASFISSFIIFGSAVFYFIIFPVIRYNVFVGPSSYNYQLLYPLQALISLIVIFCLTLVDSAVLAGSTVFIWKRRGHLWGIITIMLIFWLIFYIGIVLVIFMILSIRPNYYDYPTSIPMDANPPVIRPEMMKGGP